MKKSKIIPAVYFDACCLNRPFDNQTQYRIRVETEAILFIMASIKAGRLLFIGSEVLDLEIDKIPDPERKRRIKSLMDNVHYSVSIKQEDIQRAKELQLIGFRPYDALHIACAENYKLDVLLTTDDRLLNLAGRLSKQIKIKVANPAKWLEEVIIKWKQTNQ
jgi:predicted nucleic acid-binding protein